LSYPEEFVKAPPSRIAQKHINHEPPCPVNAIFPKLIQIILSSFRRKLRELLVVTPPQISSNLRQRSAHGTDQISLSSQSSFLTEQKLVCGAWQANRTLPTEVLRAIWEKAVSEIEVG